ncbi:MAG: N-formylglutamate amidohydrolase [Anaerolineaceae bacterium]|nr:N-formylglutamate amidohydrolase [Anaerolineaceae bacterium]MCB9098997.1 N-formylglutamate amidohydrolase [Anaerolineales bacterium]
MTDLTIWELQQGDSPLVATAIHNGHAVREEVAALLALPEADRLREEDPFTGNWTVVAPTRLVGLRSRFEVDLNRPREKAVYIEPEDAWGLHVWREKPSEALIQRSLQQYDAFYNTTYQIFSALEQKFGRFVVFDLHSYNYRREGPTGPPADPEQNPEVNVGTGSLDRARWGPMVDRFMADLQAFNYLGRHLDVRENVKFKGGEFARWSHATFPQSACVLAIEFKKFFMDEWTGEPDPLHLAAIRQALESTVPGVLESL